MSEVKIYVSKNDKKTSDKQPDLRVAKVEEVNGKSQFTDIGGLWKSKSGKGYSGRIDLDAKPFVKTATPAKEEDGDFDW